MPIAIRAGLLMMLSQKMSYVSKNYEFVSTMIEDIFKGLVDIAKPIGQVNFRKNYKITKALLDFKYFYTGFLIRN